MINEQNWARNYTYRAARLHMPETVEQVQELVTRCRKLKALGTRHSFNSIADTTEDLVSLENLDQILELDHARRTVMIEGGVKYGPLSRYLSDQGYALPNLASLPHISVAGACATATHGSGDRNKNLAAAVAAMELVTASGEVVALSREHDSETFPGAVVHLGGLGIITKLTLDVFPTFEVRQDVYRNLSLAQAEMHFEEIESSAYSVSLFTDWQSANFGQVWFKRRLTDGTAFTPEPNLFGATLATTALHPIATLSAENCTQQLGICGSWHERLPHFRMEYTPSSGEELQTEYYVPRHHAVAAFHALHAIGEQLGPLLQISEVRTIDADDLWMSPCYQQPCVSIHFTWIKDWPVVEKLLPVVERQLDPFQARPHWGKLFTMPSGRLPSLFPKLPDFQRLLRSYDPAGKFRNAFLDTYLFSG